MIVWHDEEITAEKCIDTAPVVCPRSVHIHTLCHRHPEGTDLLTRGCPLQFPGDPIFPYVGKYIANLTLSQIRTLDCGTKRQLGYRKALPISMES